ncbi:MAG: MBL fold metallo-hydrolase [Planctomycetaceae bacterium]
MMTLPHLRISEPHEGLFAYYDGRLDGYRFDPRPNWVDAGALSLGIASFTLVDGVEAIVYDTGTTPVHGKAIADHLRGLCVQSVRIIYSHWHKDHVAGTAEVLKAFPDSAIIANVRTAAHLTDNKTDLESERDWPPIDPLVLPTETFDGVQELKVGAREVELRCFNIHSDDATVLWLPNDHILLAGDTLEDPITYVDEPEAFTDHLADLQRLKALNAKHILPCHGSEPVIAAGGYGPSLINAMETYTKWLHSLSRHPEHALQSVHDILADHFNADHISWFEPYAKVHEANVQAALNVGS